MVILITVFDIDQYFCLANVHVGWRCTSLSYAWPFCCNVAVLVTCTMNFYTAAPSAPPQHLRQAAITATSITLNW